MRKKDIRQLHVQTNESGVKFYAHPFCTYDEMFHKLKNEPYFYDLHFKKQSNPERESVTSYEITTDSLIANEILEFLMANFHCYINRGKLCISYKFFNATADIGKGDSRIIKDENIFKGFKHEEH